MRGAAPLVLLAALACDGPAAVDGGVDAAAPEDGGVDAGEDAGPGELVAEAGDGFYAIVGEAARLDGSMSVGATSYRWDFGDGRGWDAPRPEAVADVVYDREGRFRAFLTVSDATGRTRTDSVLVNVTYPVVHVPRAAGTVATWPAREEVAVVSPDSDELAVFSHAGDALTLVRRVATGADPRTVTVFEDRWVVVCSDDDEVDLIDADGALERVALPPRAGLTGWWGRAARCS